MQATKLSTPRVPLWLIAIDETTPIWKTPVDEYDLAAIDDRFLMCEFRGVSVERVETVLATGIDVEPSDAVLYVSTFEKAWEYGGLPKLVLALDPYRLERTFCRLGADAAAAEREEMSAQFPTVVETPDGGLYLSRLSADDPGLDSPYEMEYARWVPGDPFAALVGALVFFRPSEADHVAQAVVAAAERSRIQLDAEPAG